MSGVLVMIVGFVGAGKATLAYKLANVLTEAVILDPDEVRGVDRGFSEEARYELCMEMRRLAQTHLAEGSVVLWPQSLSLRRGHPSHLEITGREGLMKLAEAAGASWRIIQCEAPDRILWSVLEKGSGTQGVKHHGRLFLRESSVIGRPLMRNIPLILISSASVPWGV